eukprot:m.179710 g.179710  ORF g.179710 m.179710 type:complete len:50 (+) comp14835_c0_seq1:374-523(+)
MLATHYATTSSHLNVAHAPTLQLSVMLKEVTRQTRRQLHHQQKMGQEDS